MGKTNLLDAIYYLSFCKSSSNSVDSLNILHNADFLMLRGNYLFDENEEEIYCAIKRRAKKQFKRNKKEYERLAEHIGVLPLVLVSPADSELIAGGSEERRKFVDGVISQYDKRYLNSLLHYNNALKQRNSLLKEETPVNETLFDVLEEQMLLYGQYIYEQRERFVADFVPVFREIYAKISDEIENVNLSYTTQYHERDLLSYIRQTRERDLLIGFSSAGVHKDDLELLLDGYPIKRVGSQGQNKTCLISLKLAQYKFLQRIHGFSPILLLDDMFDKLDSRRVAQIIEFVSNDDFGQIFITDTNRENLDALLTQIAQESFIFQVENGCFRKA
jgi:DNA replication and repair protein RecF